MRRRSRRSRAGYTIIEVMMALGVLTAGSVAILGMIQVTTRGNLEARQMTTANQVAQLWLERLRRDALAWTTTPISPTDPAQVNATVANTTFLRHAPSPGTPSEWFVPEPDLPGETANFDFYGNDLAPGQTPHYCTNVRFAWVFPGRALRADVRVWWARRTNDSSTDANLHGCPPGLDLNALTNNPDVRMVYASTILRYTPPPP